MKGITLILPRGEVAWANTTEKDEDDKYQLRVRYPKEGADNQEEIDEMLEVLDVCQDEAQTDILDETPRNKKKTVEKYIANTNPLYSDGDESEDERNHGHWLVGGKTNYKVVAIDSKRKTLKGSAAKIMSGDVGKMKIVMKPYMSKGLKKAGLTVYPAVFQVLEKGDALGDPTDGFEDEEGYEADDSGASEDEDEEFEEENYDDGDEAEEEEYEDEGEEYEEEEYEEDEGEDWDD